MSGSLATRPCPACGAICPRTAEICYRCKKTLPDVAAAPLPPDAEERLRARLAGATTLRYPSRGEQHGTWRPATFVWLGVLFTGIALTATSEAKSAPLAIGLIMLFVALVPALALLVADLVAASPRGRATPERAVRAFVTAVARGRWAGAWDCLSPLVHGLAVRVPAVELLRSQPATVTLAGATDLATYWRPLARWSNGRIRRLQALGVTRVGEVDGLCRLRVRLRVMATPTWTLWLLPLLVWPGLIAMVATQKQVDFSFEVLAHQRAGQWWLVGGDVPTPGAPSAILEGSSVNHDA